LVLGAEGRPDGPDSSTLLQVRPPPAAPVPGLLPVPPALPQGRAEAQGTRVLEVTGGRIMTIATGFAFQPLLDANVLIEFFDDDGKTSNSQIVSPEAIR
jgi:hypothetical protein